MGIKHGVKMNCYSKTIIYLLLTIFWYYNCISENNIIIL